MLLFYAHIALKLKLYKSNRKRTKSAFKNNKILTQMACSCLDSVFTVIQTEHSSLWIIHDQDSLPWLTETPVQYLSDSPSWCWQHHGRFRPYMKLHYTVLHFHLSFYFPHIPSHNNNSITVLLLLLGMRQSLWQLALLFSVGAQSVCAFVLSYCTRGIHVVYYHQE